MLIFNLIKSWLSGALIMIHALSFFLVAHAHGQSNALIAGRYEVLGDGSEIKDKQTGLIWQRCSIGQRWENQTCAGDAIGLTWNEAQALSKGVWRIPTLRELASLINCSSRKMKATTDPDGGGSIKNTCKGNYQRPTIDITAFPNTLSDFYWSSSHHVVRSGYAWFVYFYYGNVSYSGHHGSYFRVRLVR